MTSVNNNENNAKFYQFLKQNGGINAADGNGDGAITKTEFRKFLEENNFDFKSLEGWNGEKATKSENDLINNFWKTINTNTSTSKIKGTKVRNSAALDTNEQQKVMNKIIASEQLDVFMETVEIPSFVSGQDAVKQEIKENLMSLIEKNILKNTTKELDSSVLTKFLETNVSKIKNQAVAEQYASECIVEFLGDATKEYNYKYGDDATLKTMINNLVKNISQDTEESEIQEAIEDLIKGYLATAGIGDGDIPQSPSTNRASFSGDTEEDTGVTASSVWYNPSDNSTLNDLQKAVLEKELKTNFENIVKSYGKDYESYKDLFDKAVNDFIDEMLKGTKYGTFETSRRAGKIEFETSEIGKKLLKTVQVKNIIAGTSLETAITKELSKALADYIGGNRKYLPAMTTIENTITQKVLDGEYGEPIDEQSIIADIVKEIKSNIAEFYTNGFSDMDLETLNKTYDVMKETAVAEPNADKSLQAQRDAAIKYCDALAKKNDKFKEVVNFVFDGDYKSAINKMMPTEIDAKITEIKAKTAELGDASTFELDETSWNNVTTISVLAGETNTFDLTPAFKDNAGNVVKPTSDRITYKSSNALATVSSDGTVTISGGNQRGNFDTTIQIFVDGVVVGERKIEIVIKEKIDLSTVNAGFEGKNIAEHLSDGHTALKLSAFAPWKNAKTNAKNAINSYLDKLVTILKDQGYDANRLQNAAESTKNYYNAVIDAIYDNCYGSGSNRNTNIEVKYVDADGNTKFETTWYNQNTHEYERDAGRTDQGARNIAHDSCGIRMNESYSGTNTYEYYINTAVLLNKFQSFLNAI